MRIAFVSDPRVPKDPSYNTAAIAALAVLRLAAQRGLASELAVELSIEKGLPLAGGMGGSAASAVAGAVAANALLAGAGLPQDALMQAALEAEAVVAGRHLDNVAPSLFGGAVLVVGVDPPRVTRLQVAASVGLVLVTPAYSVATAKARSILPAAIPRGDAVAQAGHLGRLLLGLERGDGDLLRSCMEDRVAEPARLALYPGFVEARSAALAAGAYGVCVSGAGPTILALAPAGEPCARVGEALASGYRSRGIKADVHACEVDAQGARLIA